MSKPSIENIDRWLFDYQEGNLSASQVADLEHFMLNHPDLDVDVDAWKSAEVLAEGVPAYVPAANLYKTTNTSYYYIGAGAVAVALTVLIGFNSFFTPSSTYFMLPLNIAKTEIQGIKEDLLTLEDDNFTTNKQHDAQKQYDNQKFNLKEASARNEKTSPKLLVQHKSPITSGTPYLKKSIELTQTSINNPTFTYSSLDLHTFKTEELPEVIASINIIPETSRKSKTTFSTVKTSKSLMSRLSDMSRKVKKMADQPVALRNAKDPYFHAPMMTGFNANFGMVGTKLRNRFQATSRMQWFGKENQQFMNIVSWDNYIYELRGGVGVDVMYSDYNEGSLQNTSVGLTYSPKISVSKNVSIEPAFRFKMGVMDLNTSSPIVGRDIELHRQQVRGVFADGSAPIGSQLWYRDIGAGLLINTKWFYAGVNVDNLRGHYDNIYSADISAKHSAPAHITSIIGTDFKPRGKSMIYSAYLMHQKFDQLNEIWAGGNVEWKGISIGAGVNNHLDFGASLGINTKSFSIHYNMDYLDSRLLDGQFISHQLTMRIMLKPNRFAKRFFN